jgi:hypothetical protein
LLARLEIEAAKVPPVGGAHLDRVRPLADVVERQRSGSARYIVDEHRGSRHGGADVHGGDRRLHSDRLQPVVVRLRHVDVLLGADEALAAELDTMTPVLQIGHGKRLRQQASSGRGRARVQLRSTA